MAKFLRDAGMPKARYLIVEWSPDGKEDPDGGLWLNERRAPSWASSVAQNRFQSAADAQDALLKRSKR